MSDFIKDFLGHNEEYGPINMNVPFSLIADLYNQQEKLENEIIIKDQIINNLEKLIEKMKNMHNCQTVLSERGCLKDDYHECPCDHWTLCPPIQ
jgi:hypothetical protein